MNKKIVGILAFVVGAAAGAFGSRFLLEKKYQDNLKEEMSKIQEYYKTKDNPVQHSGTIKASANITTTVTPEEKEKAALKARNKPEVMNYAAMAKELGYQGEPVPIDVKNPQVAPSKPKKQGNTKPYVIPYEEYGRKDGQEISSLTYYMCGTLAEDDDNVLDPAAVERIVTRELLEANFTPDADEGAGRENSIYVRNQLLSCDYEILRDYRTYFEVVGDHPESRMN